MGDYPLVGWRGGLPVSLWRGGLPIQTTVVGGLIDVDVEVSFCRIYGYIGENRTLEPEENAPLSLKMWLDVHRVPTGN